MAAIFNCCLVEKNNYISSEKLVNIELKKIESLLFENKLSLNTQKSTIVMFG